MHEAKPPEVVDVNGDGRTDIVSGQENFDLYTPPRIGEVDWWQNTTLSSTVTVPLNTVLPTVSGTTQEDQTLSTSDGNWTGSPTDFSYAWERCDRHGNSCTAVPAATTSSYILTSADVGSTIRATVTAGNGNGSTSTDTSATAVVDPTAGSSLGTFGNTAPGSSSMRPSAGYNYGSVFRLSETAKTIDFKFYAGGGSAAQRFTPLIYNVDSSGAPTTLVTSGAEVTVAAGQAAGWVISTLPVVPLAPGSYMLALLAGPTDSSATVNYTTVGDPAAGQHNAIVYPYTYPTPPADWGVTQNDSHLSSFYVDYTTSGSTGSAPVNTNLPVISGTAQQGQSLSGSNGNWSNNPTSYRYQWQRCNPSGASCTSIAAGTSASYTAALADLAHTLRVVVIASNAVGPSSPATSTATAVVSVSTSASGVPSSIAALGNSLTRAFGATGSAEDAPLESWSTGSDTAVNSVYQRLLALNAAIGGNAFNDAVSGSTMADIGGEASTAVSQGAAYVTIWAGTNDVCTSTTAGMTSVASFSSSLQTTLTDLTQGLPGVRVMVLSVPDWYGFWQAYQANAAATWTANGRCPDLFGLGATSADRTAVQERISDLNAAIVTVCGQFSACSTDGGAVFQLWPTLPPSSLAFDFFHLSPSGEAVVAAAVWAATPWGKPPQPPVNTSLPVISGSAQQGQSLTGSNGAWSNSPSSYGYQWQRCNSSGAACVAIPAAIGNSYLLVAADVGATLRFQVTATNGSGPASATSVQTAVVTAAPRPAAREHQPAGDQRYGAAGATPVGE